MIARSLPMRFAALAFIIISMVAARVEAAEPYAVNPAASRVTISVGKAGVLSFAAGHTHEVAGPISSGALDIDRDDPSRSRLRLIIRTADLKVNEKGEPAGDASKVQQTMASDQVLDVARYPEIRFESTSITVKAHQANAFDLEVTGQLTLHGVTGPIAVPVHAELSADVLRATGRFSIKQTAYGITPVSVGGVVKVKDALDIELVVAASR